ncbi:MAG: carboxylesterase family protein [Bacilli bacterium]|nr:carboxylesterase family protein [Bacilli bacterium]
MKKIIALILFILFYSILSFLFLFYLDLANGPMYLLFLEIVVILLGLAFRIIFNNKRVRFKMLAFFILIFLNVPILLLAHPAYVTLSPVSHIKETEVLELKNGKIVGTYNEDDTVRIYAGVPYAEAPVGDLRFKETKKLENWDGIKKCVNYAPRAMQVDTSSVMNTIVDIYASKAWHPNYKMQPLQEMSEDCLYLNIYRPNTDEVNLPILVYIHGGSLTTGSSSSYDINGETYAKNGLIMITVAYRLNIFGYLATEDLALESTNHTTGNYGLLDQIEALKWINENAIYFGGDKDKITIAGESAGSSSISALCTSPLASGLFKQAIGESSSLVVSTPPHTYRPLNEALKTGANILKEFNATNANDLRQIDAKKLVRTKYANSEMTLDGYALTKSPYQVYLDHENNEEALLNGYNIKEADAFLIPSFLFTRVTKNNIEEILSNYFNNDIASKIYNLYKDKIEEDALGALCEIISVYWFIHPHHSWSNMAILNGEKVYRYQFTKENGYYGTYHSGEIVYAYGNLNKSIHKYAYDDSDYALEAKMVKYFTNFIKYGNPNIDCDTNWDQYVSNGKVLEFGEDVKMIDDKYLSLYAIIEEYLNSEE